MSCSVVWKFPCQKIYKQCTVSFLRPIKCKDPESRSEIPPWKVLFNGIEITFSIHGNEGMSLTMLNFQRFSRSLVSFRPFFLSFPIYLIYTLLCNWRIHYTS